MSRLYPSLDEKFKSEGICPICLVEMADSPRFSCDSEHAICQRCRAYFFNCPRCLQPLHEMPSQGQDSHPYPPASAPSLEDFHERERQQQVPWTPQPMPRGQSELLDCPYAHLGCTAKFVGALRDMHVSRCQYKHHSSEEEQLTRVTGFGDPAERVPCRYETHGCNAHLPLGRLRDHEEICIYKSRDLPGYDGPSFEHCRAAPPAPSDDRVFCRYQSVGCNVRSPDQRRLRDHEQICIYKDREPSPPRQSSSEEDDRVFCKYRSVGCNVRAPHERLQTHEDMCIYKDRALEELGHRLQGSCHYPRESAAGCRYRDWGCNVRMPYERLRGHEDMCIYKDR